LPQNNAKASKKIAYDVSSLHCNPVKSLSFARIPTPMMAEFLTQSRRDAKAQRVFPFLASPRCYPQELRIFDKIFTSPCFFSVSSVCSRSNPLVAASAALRLRVFALRGPCFIRGIPPCRGSILFGCGWPLCDLCVLCGQLILACGSAGVAPFASVGQESTQVVIHEQFISKNSASTIQANCAQSSLIRVFLCSRPCHNGLFAASRGKSP